MEIRRVALIYDDRDRPETTGVYCRRALGRLLEATHLLPDQLTGVQCADFDLYLNIDDGIEYHLPPELKPCAWWAIDTHLNFDWCRDKAQNFDLVFAAQQDGAERLRREGIASAKWLPLACDPEIHAKHDLPKQYDFAFVGNVFPGPRAELLELLRRRFPQSFIGRAFFEEMARIYSAARWVLNRSLKNDVNMRVFEAMASGSLLLTNDLSENGQTDFFRDGVHLATYRDADELLDKADYYLKHPEVRERIAAAGAAEVQARHTYLSRMQSLLESIENQSRTVRMKVPSAVESTPDLSYYEFARPEILALIPLSARRILDVGCGAGRLGEAIKARQSAEVVGVELVPEAAARARGRLDEIICGDVEEVALPFRSDEFDWIVCGDVIEHLREPRLFLKRARSWLRAEGSLVASVPNVRHYSVVTSLLDGNWTYESAGLLDETHLSFFTRADLLDLFDRVGFAVTDLRAVPGPGYDEWQALGRPGEVRVGKLHIRDIPASQAEEFFVYQYLLVAKPRLIPNAEQTATAEKEGAIWAATPIHRDNGHLVPKNARPLRIAFLGNFQQAWSTETYAADALENVGQAVHRIHEYGVASVSEVLRQIDEFGADCLLFFKGRIGVDASDPHAVLHPDPSKLIEVLRRSPAPAYMWYYDRVHEYEAEPSRLGWMRQVAPLCRVAFVTDGGLATTRWANWRVLRQGISQPLVQNGDVRESDREDLAFVGQIYGARSKELESIQRVFKVNVISQVFGRELSAVVRRHRIILGLHYPSAPGYWSDRVYVVLGHGGFFLAPEVSGMREEGLEPGVHYARLGADPLRDIRYWLDRPEERARIAKHGQELVLSRFTYEDRVRELCEVISATLASRDGTVAQTAQSRSADDIKPESRAPLVEQRSSHAVTSDRSGARHRFRHRRKLGDIIYSLPALRAMGGGILYLDPTSFDGTQDQAYWRRQFVSLIPFLQRQPYLEQVRIHEGEAIDIDLEAYLRTTHGTPGDRVTIAANHFIGLGLEAPETICPWLVADQHPSNYPIVIHRSFHYHGHVDYSFLRDFVDVLYCVGSADERAPLEAIGARPIVTNDVRELAAAINSSSVFIGNQSLPLALAVGLGKRRMIEESDSLPNASSGGQDEFVMTSDAETNRSGLLRLLESARCSPNLLAGV